MGQYSIWRRLSRLFAITSIAAFALMISLSGVSDAAAKSRALPEPPQRPAHLLEIANPEARLIAQAVKAVKRNRWARLTALQKQAKSPLTVKLITYLRLSAPSGPATLEELQRFKAENGHWPAQRTLRRKVEKSLAAGGQDQAVFDWFEENPPISSLGQIRLGEALMRDGKRDEAIALFREAWISGNFSRRDEKRFLRLHRKHLTAADHKQRMDRLLWEGRRTAAKRVMWKLPTSYQKLGQARIALRRKRGNVDALIKQVPRELRDDPGLIYERVRWRRKKGRDSAIELLRDQPATHPEAKRWWVERRVLARKALRLGYITDAYRIAKNHGLTDGAGFAEGEWLAGWIALRFLQEPATALPHFKLMYQRVKFPVSRARGAYWVGRTYQALDMDKQAAAYFRAAAIHPTTYYGQLATGELDPTFGPSLPEAPEIGSALIQDFQGHELTLAARLLAEAGASRPLAQVLFRLEAVRGDDPAWQSLAAQLAIRLDRPDLGIRAAKRALRDGVFIAEAGYPQVYLPRLKPRWNLPQPEKAFVHALIRQESAFRTDAVSTANARGLMQIIPPTAKRVARRLGLPYSKRRLLTDPQYNLTLGQAYISGLVEDFDGSYVVALAAYNAGPSRARRWIRDNGDPRTPDIDAIDWIELIPFTETRNYVQRVMENLQVYRLKLGGPELALAPESDLNR